MKTKTIAWVALSAGLITLACVKEIGGGSPTGTTETSGAPASATPTAPVAAPAKTSPPAAPAEVVPATTAAPSQVESVAALPSPAVLQAVDAARARLDGFAAKVEGARVRFVDCDDAGKCGARLEAPTLAGLRDLLQSVSGDSGGIGFEAREQLDAYSGRSFVADVTLATANARAIPSDEGALLDPNGT
jgi:hypothetical protein